MSTSGTPQTLALWRPAPRKVGQDVRAFRETSAPLRDAHAHRWTFTSALPASVHCPSAALRPLGFACFRSSLRGMGTPELTVRFVEKPVAEVPERELGSILP